MRVLFTVWPGKPHLYPAVPLAWALLAAGHSVCFACHADLAEDITAAGLTAVPLGSPGSLAASAAGIELMPEADRERLARALGIGPAERHDWDMVSVFLLSAIRMFHTVGPAREPRCPTVDDLVDFAADWRPDLVLWDTWPAAAVAARTSGAAHARLLWGPDYCAWLLDRFAARRGELPPGTENPLIEVVRPVAQRYGLPVDEDLLLGQWAIDATPDALHLPVRASSVPMRWVPYTAGGAVPDWLYPPPERPRVAITLGTTAQLFEYTNEPLIASLLELVGGMDIEVVATLTAAQLAGQAVPGNVRVVDYLPLNQLLPTCSALIHHGGFGSFAAAVAQRVPQLIEMAAGVESPAYARYLTAHGAGLTLNHTEQSVPQLRERLSRVLTEPAFQAGAASLHADWLAMPGPSDVVPVLEQLAGRGTAPGREG